MGEYYATTARGRAAHGRALGVTGSLLGLALMIGTVQAQTQTPYPAPAAKPQAFPTQTTTPSRPAAPAKTAAAKPVTSAETKTPEAGLRGRVEQLEEQFVDVQVTLGTLESLARQAGTQASSATYRAGPTGVAVGADQVRVDALETELRALSADVRRLSDELRAARNQPQAAPAGAYQPSPAPAPKAAAIPVEREVVAALPLPVAPVAPQVVQPVPVAPLPPIAPALPPGFGQTTVQSGPPRDSINQILGAQSASTTPPLAPTGLFGGATPKQSYDTAYGYLLQQDYGAAQAAFEDYLQRFPNDELAGNAQYWLGETFYLRAQYKPAATAYLKGYQTYATSTKAPDSLFKLAMSLDRLGQKDAACSSYVEFGTRFPSAPSTLKARADNERKRLGC